MGQQQLLLLVLSIVLVGLAVVVGIEAFAENQRKSQIDAMTTESIDIASDAQAWLLKPVAFGGPTEGQGFLDLTYGDLGIVIEDGVYLTENAAYRILSTASDCLTIDGFERVSYDAGSFDGPSVAVAVTGQDPDDVRVWTDGTEPTCE